MPSFDERAFDVTETSVPEILGQLLSQRFSGEVTFEADGTPQHVVGFAGGLPRWCEADVPGTRLGDLLVDAGAVEEKEIDAMFARGGCGQGRRLGECLIEERVVDKKAVRKALQRQCELRLTDLCRLAKGRAVATSGDTVKHAAYPVGRTYPVVLAGVREHFDEARLDAILGDRLKQVFSGTRLLRRRRKEFDFSKEDDAAVEELMSPDGVAFDEWRRRTSLNETGAKQLLYALFACDLVESAGPVTKTPRRPTSETPAIKRAPVDLSVPRTMPKEPGELARFLVGKPELKEDPFGALGLDPGANLEMIDGAGAVIQSQLDIAASEGSGVVRCETAARRVDSVVLEARKLREEICRRDGQAAVEEKRWSDALVLYEDLLELRKRDFTARAALAWIRYQLSEKASDDAHRALDRLNFLAGSNSATAELHARRGQLMSSLKNYRGALAAFERALELDPQDDASARGIDESRTKMNLELIADKPEPEPDPDPIEDDPAPGDPERSPWLSGRWPMVWALAGLALIVLAAAQIMLRMDV